MFLLIGNEPSDLFDRAFDRGFAYFVAVVAVWLAYLYFKSRIELKKEKLRGKLCLGESCPYRIATEEAFVSLSQLQNHVLFGYIESVIRHRIPTLPIREAGRAAITKDFLEFKFTAVRHEFGKLVMRDDLEELSDQELETAIYLTINRAVSIYEERAEREGIPEVFRVRFKVIHGVEVQRLLEFVETVCETDWYGSNLQKIAIVFDEVKSVLVRTVGDAARTLGTVNGELDGKVYKGITVMPIEHPKKIKTVSDIMEAREKRRLDA